MNITNTKTEKNLWEAFAGESMARNKYTYYGSVAKKEGYNQIADFFLETANNEKEHAKIWFKLLEELRDTSYNLEQASAGEHDEWENMYPRMAKEAREEGFEKIALLFEKVAEIEKEHEERYKKLLNNIKAGTVFERDLEQEWKCNNCGHIHKGKSALQVCPVCKHPKAFFQINSKNY